MHDCSFVLLTCIIPAPTQVAAIFPVEAFVLVEAVIKMYDWNLVWALELVYADEVDVSSLTLNLGSIVLSDSLSPATSRVAVSGVRDTAAPANLIRVHLAGNISKTLAPAAARSTIILTLAPEYLKQNELVVGIGVEAMEAQIVPVGMLQSSLWFIGLLMIMFCCTCSHFEGCILGHLQQVHHGLIRQYY
jgi:hypothetical protein